MENVDQWRSKDFYLSAVCLAADCKLERLEQQNQDFVEFVFKDSPERCIELIESHWAGELKLPTKKLVEAINELKTRLHVNNRTKTYKLDTFKKE